VEAFSSDRQELRFAVNGGLDVYTQKFDLISPPELWFEDDDGLPGTRVLSYANSQQSNLNLSGVHVFRPSMALQATSSFGSSSRASGPM
jgi:hypothetical protein